jgi:CRISPR type III-associated protein (TIGR04423 family)
MAIRRITKLADIPTGNYQGYYWLSDREHPQLLQNSAELAAFAETNPFIIEAMLWDEQQQRSIMITHTGTQQIFEYNLATIAGRLEKKEYQAHRIPGYSTICFDQLWQAEPDDNCNGMQVLKLKAHIFTGLKK